MGKMVRIPTIVNSFNSLLGGIEHSGPFATEDPFGSIIQVRRSELKCVFRFLFSGFRSERRLMFASTENGKRKDEKKEKDRRKGFIVASA